MWRFQRNTPKVGDEVERRRARKANHDLVVTVQRCFPLQLSGEGLIGRRLCQHRSKSATATRRISHVRCTERSNWIQHRKWKNSICCTRGNLVTRIKHKFSKNGWAELKFLSPSIIPHLSSLKFGTVGLDRLCIG